MPPIAAVGSSSNRQLHNDGLAAELPVDGGDVGGSGDKRTEDGDIAAVVAVVEPKLAAVDPPVS